MAKIIFLTNKEQLVDFIQTAHQRFQEQVADFIKIDVAMEMVTQQEAQVGKNERLAFQAPASLTIISWMGSGQDPYVQHTLQLLKTHKMPYFVISTHVGEPIFFNGITQAQAESIRDYLLYSGSENMDNLFLFIGNVFCSLAVSFSLPVPVPWCGIYYPGLQAPMSIEDYQTQCYDMQKPTVGVLFPRDAWLSKSLEPHDRLIHSLLDKGVNVIPVFSHWMRDDTLQIPGSEDAIIRHFVWDGKTVVDAVINLMWHSLTIGRPLYNGNYLMRLNVPVIQGVTLLDDPDKWRASKIGLTPGELVSNIVMPEFDGVIHGVPFAGRMKSRSSGELTFYPVPDRIELLARRACKWANLKRKPNYEKKIAVIFHNYPPSDATIGTAIGLDSPRSVEQIIHRLADAGYQVGDTLPESGYWLLEQLLEQVTNDRTFLSDSKVSCAENRFPRKSYQSYFDTLSTQVKTQLVKGWGDPPGEVFCYDDDLLIPGLRLGNIFVSVQPPRGFGEKPSEVYHSSELAPTHHYLAYYRWIREKFQADAVIHVGTHGSLEWLPGKGTGLSDNCYPALAIDDLPNIYPYIITIVCEGIQAKRRANACLIGHLPAPVSDAGTYDEIAALEILIADYRHCLENQPEKRRLAETVIKEKIAATNLDSDMPKQADESFDTYVNRLHGYIDEIKDMNVRVGLHVLGQAPEQENLSEYLLAMTRVDNNEVPSLRRVVARLLGYDYDEICDMRSGMTAEGIQHTVILEHVRACCWEVIVVLAQENYKQDNGCLHLSWVVDGEKAVQEELLQICRYICFKLVPALKQTEQELTNIIRSLDGAYVEPGPAGAPTSGMADVLPTGRNFYGVDPRAIPSVLAWEVGKTLADALLETFLADEGKYPENVGMIFWSGNNMRTKGQCIAEFLYLMGVCPVWQKSSGRVVGLQVIPLTELQRPRIDVTARISGMFRDSLPPAIDLLDEAADLVANLDEPLEMNYIRKHVLEEKSILEEQGVPAEEAQERAQYRVFSCQPGTYGAGIALVLENKNWSSLEDLAKVYVTWGAYAYTRNKQGVFVPDSFTRQLAKMDATVKNEDNYEVNMLDSDDFNAFHGGMIAAVRSLRGTAPRSYCGDSSDASQIKVRSLEEETKRLYRSEVLNPKYIEGMKKHGYKGAADLAAVVSHSFEWSATSDVIEDWMYDELTQKYALDPAMQTWMKEVNPWALMRIANKLLEAEARNLWNADAGTVKQLQQLYLSIEGDLEERSDT